MARDVDGWVVHPRHGVKEPYWSPEFTIERLGKLLKAARVKRSLNHKQAAAMSGLRQSHISKIENGKLSPRFADVIKLADTYDLQSLSSLCHWTRERRSLDRIIRRNFKLRWPSASKKRQK